MREIFLTCGFSYGRRQQKIDLRCFREPQLDFCLLAKLCCPSTKPGDFFLWRLKKCNVTIKLADIGLNKSNLILRLEKWINGIFLMISFYRERNHFRVNGQNRFDRLRVNRRNQIFFTRDETGTKRNRVRVNVAYVSHDRLIWFGEVRARHYQSKQLEVARHGLWAGSKTVHVLTDKQLRWKRYFDPGEGGNPP